MFQTYLENKMQRIGKKIDLDFNLVILMNINLDMVLVILSILCVHAELKLKLQNISSCVVNFTVLKD